MTGKQSVRDVTFPNAAVKGRAERTYIGADSCHIARPIIARSEHTF